jgi:acyl carrier protein
MTTTEAVIRPTPDQVFAVVRDALAVVCDRPRAGIDRDSLLVDLGVDSLALVAFAEVVEERLSLDEPGRRLGDDELEGMRTVGDAVDHLVARL